MIKMIIFTIVMIKNGNIHHRYYQKWKYSTSLLSKMVILTIVIIKNRNIQHPYYQKL
jgi:hypothetical protein